MRKLFRLGAILGVGLGMTTAALVPTPAQAAVEVTVEFSGTASITPGLSLVRPTSGHFSFSSSACVAVEAGKKVTAAGQCTVEATGSFGTTVPSTCGALTGTGSGTISIGVNTYDFTFTITTTGGELHATLTTIVKRNTGQRGAGTAEGTARPRTATDCTTETGEETYDLVNVVATGAVA